MRRQNNPLTGLGSTAFNDHLSSIRNLRNQINAAAGSVNALRGHDLQLRGRVETIGLGRGLTLNPVAAQIAALRGNRDVRARDSVGLSIISTDVGSTVSHGRTGSSNDPSFQFASRPQSQVTHTSADHGRRQSVESGASNTSMVFGTPSPSIASPPASRRQSQAEGRQSVASLPPMSFGPPSPSSASQPQSPPASRRQSQAEGRQSVASLPPMSFGPPSPLDDGSLSVPQTPWIPGHMRTSALTGIPEIRSSAQAPSETYGVAQPVSPGLLSPRPGLTSTSSRASSRADSLYTGSPHTGSPQSSTSVSPAVSAIGPSEPNPERRLEQLMRGVVRLERVVTPGQGQVLDASQPSQTWAGIGATRHIQQRQTGNQNPPQSQDQPSNGESLSGVALRLYDFQRTDPELRAFAPRRADEALEYYQSQRGNGASQRNGNEQGRASRGRHP
jgi:hypothetical protein